MQTLTATPPPRCYFCPRFPATPARRYVTGGGCQPPAPLLPTLAVAAFPSWRFDMQNTFHLGGGTSPRLPPAPYTGLYPPAFRLTPYYTFSCSPARTDALPIQAHYSLRTAGSSAWALALPLRAGQLWRRSLAAKGNGWTGGPQTFGTGRIFPYHVY